MYKIEYTVINLRIIGQSQGYVSVGYKNGTSLFVYWKGEGYDNSSTCVDDKLTNVIKSDVRGVP